MIERAISVRDYYNAMLSSFSMALQKIDKQISDIEDDCVGLRDKVAVYADKLDVDVRDYKEFKQDKYIDGKLFNILSTIVHDFRTKDDVKIYAMMIYSYAAKRKAQYELARRKESYTKALSLSFSDYRHIIKTFYYKVQSALLDGKGYEISSGLGWLCFNRVLIKNDKKVLDYAATAANKKKLLSEGKILWNKDEAEKAELDGIEYKGVDYRIYRNVECVYEFPILFSKFNKGMLKISYLNWRTPENQIHNADLLKKTNGNVNKIKALDVDLKTKLSLCLQADKMLYLKFIRNEAQTSYKYRKTYRQD